MDTDNYQKVADVDENSTTTKKDYIKKVTLLILYILVLVFGGLTGSGKIGKSQKYLADKYNTLITPPSYAFSIWAVIYVFWAAYLLLTLFTNKYMSNPTMVYSDSIKG